MQARPTHLNLFDTLASAHDAVTLSGYTAAIAGLATIVFSYCYEVIARYAFSAPTIWAGSLVSYALCCMVFLALPRLTQAQGHISITILSEMISQRHAVALQRAIRLLSAAACLIATWITAEAALSQYRQDIQTISEWPIAKWPLSFLMTYGWFSSGLYFLRQIPEGLPDSAPREVLP